jgi:5-carboxymethyl-2-hydroxymuconate isomerase
MNAEEITKSAEARLHAIGTFHTTAIRSRASHRDRVAFGDARTDVDRHPEVRFGDW